MEWRNFIKKSLNWNSKKVAVFIVNYNMPERVDALFYYLKRNETWPIDIYLIDNGSDITLLRKIPMYLLKRMYKLQEAG